MLESDVIRQLRKIRYPERKHFIEQFLKFCQNNDIERLTKAMELSNKQFKTEPTLYCRWQLNKLVQILVDTEAIDNIDVEFVRFKIDNILKVFDYPKGATE